MNFSLTLRYHKAFWWSLKTIKAACDNCLYLFFLLYTECVIRYYKRRNEQNCGGNVNDTLRCSWKFLLVAKRCFITILLPFEQGFAFLYKKQNSLLHIKIYVCLTWTIKITWKNPYLQTSLNLWSAKPIVWNSIQCDGMRRTKLIIFVIDCDVIK